jgi:hypothetical protein
MTAKMTKTRLSSQKSKTQDTIGPRQSAPESGLDQEYAADERLQAELDAVREELKGAIKALPSPLQEFIGSQVWDTAVLPRAIIALTTGFPPPGTDPAPFRRISLAAALELLHVALTVHELLVLPHRQNDRRQLDRSLTGGTILAGDFCFSRAAELAVRTESPQVVSVFAEAVKQMSEARLRRLFRGDDEPFLPDEILLRSAAIAGSILADLPIRQCQANADLSAALGRQMGRDGHHFSGQVALEETPLAGFQKARWLAALAWLEAAH